MSIVQLLGGGRGGCENNLLSKCVLVVLPACDVAFRAFVESPKEPPIIPVRGTNCFQH